MNPETSLETVKLDPFGSGTDTAYDVEFLSFDAENRHAAFTFAISEAEPDLSAASISPIDGWAAWLDGELVVAFSYQDADAIGCARLEVAVGGADEDEIDRGALALGIAIAILSEGTE